jgi:hypothetical protein
VALNKRRRGTVLLVYSQQHLPEPKLDHDDSDQFSLTIGFVVERYEKPFSDLLKMVTDIDQIGSVAFVTDGIEDWLGSIPSKEWIFLTKVGIKVFFTKSS